MTRRVFLAVLCVAAVCVARAQSPIRYRFSFPEPQHRWMQVDATFPDVRGVLELRVSRSSPGRYSLHDFAKNVYDVHAFDTTGRELSTVRPDPYGWNVAADGGAVTIKYKVYGDRIDGTYLAIDETHAHINMPAAVMWARGLDDRPIVVDFELPARAQWTVATQLHGSGLEYTAPNLQYLMDSPTEFGTIAMREFTVGSTRFRFALHHLGSDAELDAFTKDVQRIVRQEGAVYGEYPAYEPGYYTFLAEYVPWAHGDGMEHRNSTVMSSAASIASGRVGLLDTVAHEFFHCWNVERIRPQGLEPFDFDRANMTDSLWLAEGFTQYYGPLMLKRAGLVDLNETARTMGQLVDAVVNRPARHVRSAVDMSRLAPFIDGGTSIDRTNWSTTVLSYYTFGGAIALAMDLSLRDRTDGRVALDDYMRAMWRRFGKPGGAREGYVDRPYSLGDAESTLADVAGDRAFAHDFFARYIEGHDAADYARLLGRAGLILRKRNPGKPWLGDLRFDARNGVRVTNLDAQGWPAYASGLDQDDELRQVDGQAVRSEGDVIGALQRHRPGDRVQIVFVDRTGRARAVGVTLAEDPHVEIVPIESTGGMLTSAHRSFRDGWLQPKS